jgi:hypothetical protein
MWEDKIFRWQDVQEQEVFDMTVKMYRDPFVAQSTVTVPGKNIELDHYAYRHLGSELYMYKILDINFENFIEERGDISRLKNILIPTQESLVGTIL